VFREGGHGDGEPQFPNDARHIARPRRGNRLGSYHRRPSGVPLRPLTPGAQKRTPTRLPLIA